MVEWVADVKKPASNLLLRQQIEQFKWVEWTRQTGSWHCYNKKYKLHTDQAHKKNNGHLWAKLALLGFTKPCERITTCSAIPVTHPTIPFWEKFSSRNKKHTHSKKNKKNHIMWLFIEQCTLSNKVLTHTKRKILQALGPIQMNHHLNRW